MSGHEIRTEKIHANGLNFEVAACGSGDRLALCLHGFPENNHSWRHQMGLLADAGYLVWAPNLRGYCGTDRPIGVEEYSLEKLMDDVAGLIDASGTSSTTLIAHDWGGVIAWYFAMRRLRPLERLVVMNLPHPAVMQKRLKDGFKQRLRSWYAVFFQLPRVPEAMLTARDGAAITGAFTSMVKDQSRFTETDLDAFRRPALQPGAATAMINYYRALVRGGGAKRQEKLGYPKISVPTLLIWGEEDRALGKDTTYGTEEFVPNLTVRYIPDVSHWVQQEAPETVNAMLDAWLRGEEPPYAGPGGRLID